MRAADRTNTHSGSYCSILFPNSMSFGTSKDAKGPGDAPYLPMLATHVLLPRLLRLHSATLTRKTECNKWNHVWTQKVFTHSLHHWQSRGAGALRRTRLAVCTGRVPARLSIHTLRTFIAKIWTTCPQSTGNGSYSRITARRATDGGRLKSSLTLSSGRRGQ